MQWWLCIWPSLLLAAITGCQNGGVFEIQPPGLLLQTGCQRSMDIHITDRDVSIKKGCNMTPTEGP